MPARTLPTTCSSTSRHGRRLSFRHFLCHLPERRILWHCWVFAPPQPGKPFGYSSDTSPCQIPAGKMQHCWAASPTSRQTFRTCHWLRKAADPQPVRVCIWCGSNQTLSVSPSSNTELVEKDLGSSETPFAAAFFSKLGKPVGLGASRASRSPQISSGSK